jgi:hypothetical protein
MDGHPARLRNRVTTPPVTFVRAVVGTGGTPTPPVPGPFAAMRWGGVYRTIGSPDFTEPATWVAAEWVVPARPEVGPLSVDASAGFWIGLDGIDGTQVIQAGVQAVADPDGGAAAGWVACAQWWAACADSPFLIVENLPVHPGDTVSCTVRVTAPALAYAMLVNITRGICTGIAIPRPGGPDPADRSRWAVGTRGGFPGGSGCPDALPEFAPVVLDACAAGTAAKILLLAGGGADGMFVDRGAASGHHPTQSWDATMTAIEAFA